MGYMLLRIFDSIFRRCYIVWSVELITLTAISVDRLLALLLGLRYRQVVTLKRTCLIAIGGWIGSIVSACTSFLNHLIVSSFVYISTAFFLVTTVCAYKKIFMSLRRNNQIHGQNHVVQGQSSQANTLNIARYRKAVYSALWVQVTLVICYLKPVDYFPVSCGSYVYLLVISQSLDSIL